jgi:hypothetical protein
LDSTWGSPITKPYYLGLTYTSEFSFKQKSLNPNMVIENIPSSIITGLFIMLLLTTSRNCLKLMRLLLKTYSGAFALGYPFSKYNFDLILLSSQINFPINGSAQLLELSSGENLLRISDWLIMFSEYSLFYLTICNNMALILYLRNKFKKEYCFGVQ